MANKKTQKKNIWLIPSAIAMGFVFIVIGIAFLYVYLVGGFKTRYEALLSFSFLTNAGVDDDSYIRLGDSSSTDKYYIFYKEEINGVEAQDYTVVVCYGSKIMGKLTEDGQEESLYYKDVIDKLFGIENNNMFKKIETIDDEEVAYFDAELFQQKVLIYQVHNITIIPEPYDATELDFDLSIEENTSGATFAIYKEKLENDGKTVIKDLKGYPVYEEIPYKISNTKRVYAKKPVEILVRQTFLDECNGIANSDY